MYTHSHYANVLLIDDNALRLYSMPCTCAVVEYMSNYLANKISITGYLKLNSNTSSGKLQ